MKKFPWSTFLGGVAFGAFAVAGIGYYIYNKAGWAAAA